MRRLPLAISVTILSVCLGSAPPRSVVGSVASASTAPTDLVRDFGPITFTGTEGTPFGQILLVPSDNFELWTRHPELESYFVHCGMQEDNKKRRIL